MSKIMISGYKYHCGLIKEKLRNPSENLNSNLRAIKEELKASTTCKEIYKIGYEVLKMVASLMKEKVSNYLGFSKVLSTICSEIPLTENEYLTNYLIYIKFIINMFVRKNYFADAIGILQGIKCTEKISGEQFKMYCDIYIYYGPLCILNQRTREQNIRDEENSNGKSIEVQDVFKNLTELINTSLCVDKAVCIQLLTDNLGTQNRLTTLLQENYEEAIEFLNALIKCLSQIENIRNFTEFYPSAIRIMLILLGIGKKHRDITHVLKFVRTCKNLKTFSNLDEKFHCQKLFCLYFIIIERCSSSDTREMNTKFVEILERFQNILHNAKYFMEEKNKEGFEEFELCCLDAIVATLPEILIAVHERVLKMLTENNLHLVIRYLSETVNILMEIDFSKPRNLCGKCNLMKQHTAANLLELSYIIYGEILKRSSSKMHIGTDGDRICNVLINKIWEPLLIIIKNFNCESGKKLQGNILAGILSNLHNFTSKCKNNKQQAIELEKILPYLNELNNLTGSYECRYLSYIFKKIYSVSGNLFMSIKFFLIYFICVIESKDVYKNYVREDFVNELRILLNSTMKGLTETTILSILNKTINNIENLEKEIYYEFSYSKYSKNYILSLLLEAILKTDLDKQAKSKLVDNLISKNIDCRLIAECVNAISDYKLVENFKLHLENSIKLLEKEKDRSKENEKFLYINYSLGLLYTRLVLYKFEEVKKRLPYSNFTEHSLNEIDFFKFKMISIEVEYNMLEIAKKSFKNFLIFIKSVEEDSREDKFLGLHELLLKDIIEYQMHIARHLRLRGYYKFTTNIWRFVYETSELIKYRSGIIRSLSYFCEEYHLCETILNEKKEFNIENKITNNLDCIKIELSNINNLTKRRQNHILICALNTACYFANVKNDNDFATDLIKYILKIMNDGSLGDSRKNTYELIRATIEKTQFKLLLNGKILPVFYKGGATMKPFAIASSIMNSIRNVHSVTSEDSLNIPTFLMETVKEITVFLMNRYSGDSTIKALLYRLVKIAADNGLSYRLINIFTLLIEMDVQLESVKMAFTKVLLIDILCDREIDNDSSIQKIRNSSPQGYNMEYLDTKLLFPVNSRENNLLNLSNDNLELVRESVNKISFLSPKKITISTSSKSLISLQKYVDCCQARRSGNKCVFCDFPELKINLFYIGCLNAQCAYINKDYKICNIFYGGIFVRFQKVMDMFEYLNILCGRERCQFYSFYINTLRRLKNLETALKRCEEGIQFVKKLKNSIDYEHLYIFTEQLASLKFTLDKKKLENVPSKGPVYKPILNLKEKKISSSAVRDEYKNLIQKCSFNPLTDDDHEKVPENPKRKEHIAQNKTNANSIVAPLIQLPKKAWNKESKSINTDGNPTEEENKENTNKRNTKIDEQQQCRDKHKQINKNDSNDISITHSPIVIDLSTSPEINSSEADETVDIDENLGAVGGSDNAKKVVNKVSSNTEEHCGRITRAKAARARMGIQL